LHFLHASPRQTSPTWFSVHLTLRPRYFWAISVLSLIVIGTMPSNTHNNNDLPNVPAASLFAVLFCLVTMVHTYQLFRTRTWWLIPFLVGGYLEWIGFVNRILTAYPDTYTTETPEILNILFILIAPVWFAASIYIVFGRIIIFVDGHHLSFIRQKWLTAIFVTSDILCFLIQAGGAVILTSNSAKTNQSTLNTAKTVIIIGLVAQIVAFGVFIITAITFYLRLKRKPTGPSMSAQVPWRKHLITVFITSSLIMIRCVFRLVEYLTGTDGYISRHESFSYVFDSTLMWFVMVILAVNHPSEIRAIIQGKGKIVQGLRMKSHASSINSASYNELQHVEAGESAVYR